MEKGDVSDEGDGDDDDDDDDESLDFLEDVPSDEEGMDDEDDDEISFKDSNKRTRQWMYSDFFDDPGEETAKPTKQKRLQFDEDEEEEDEMVEEENEEGDDKDFEQQSFEDAE